MRTNFLIFLLLCSGVILSQEKGLTPIAASSSISGKTYALVAAISDYQDNKIPDLKYAHKDAHAFARFLRSEAGGSLDEDHLTLLLNEKATMAQFVMGLFWLIEECNEGDHVIIYFAGHGDVEKKSFTQPGYLLFWDSPSKLYMGGGTLALDQLQDLISTLVVSNKASVTFIADACHSGTLAGSSVGGSQITGAKLAQQFSKEIKILSCQPDEYSIEGEQWGGGRGAFSFHLLNGLYGLADENKDYAIDLMEIRNYLEDKVSEEVAPENQNPMIVGSAKTSLFNVYPELLEKIKQLNDSREPTMGAIASRGIVDDVLNAAGDDIQKFYKAFTQSIEDKRLLLPEEDCAEFYYNKLIKASSIKKIHSRIKRNYAAALLEETQQVFNIRLNDDAKGMLHSNRSQEERYQLCIRYLKRAKEILGNEHYMFPTLKAKQLFFEGYILSLNYQTLSQKDGNIALSKFKEALKISPYMPHTYLAMSTIYGHTFSQRDSAVHYANLAAEESPTWVLPHTYTAFLLCTKYGDFDNAKKYMEKAEAINPNSVYVLNTWGNYYLAKEEIANAKLYFEKCIKEDNSFAPAHSNLGLVQMKQNNLHEAESSFKTYLSLDPHHTFVKYNLGTVYLNQNRLAEAENMYNQCINSDPDMSDAINNLGNVRFKQNRIDEALALYLRCLEINPNHIGALNNLADAYYRQGNTKEAIKALEKSYKLEPTSAETTAQLGNLYFGLKEYNKAASYLKQSLEVEPNQENPMVNLASIYITNGKVQDAKNVLEKALQLNNKNPLTYQLLGTTYRMAGQDKESISYFKTAIDLNPQLFNAYSQLGKAYVQLKNYKAAEENLKKAVSINKKAFDEQYLRARIKAVMEDNKKAYSYLEEALKMGYTDYQQLQKDKALVILREDNQKWEALMKKYLPNK